MPFAAANGFDRKLTTASDQNNIRKEIPKTSLRFVFALKVLILKEVYSGKNFGMLLDTHGHTHIFF